MGKFEVIFSENLGTRRSIFQHYHHGTCCAHCEILFDQLIFNFVLKLEGIKESLKQNWIFHTSE